MIWYATYYSKYYKWLSSQNLYLLYFFNKLFVYLDFFFIELFWVTFYNSDLYSSRKSSGVAKFTKQRFFKPVTAYLITLETKSIFINIYYKTSLERFQALNNTVVTYNSNFLTKLKEINRFAKWSF